MLKKPEKKHGSGWVLFWLGFILVMTFLVVLKREELRKGIEVVRSLYAKRGNIDTENRQAEEDVPQTGPILPPELRETPAQPPADDGLSSPPGAGPSAAPGASITGDAASPPQSSVAETRRQIYLIRLDRDGSLLASRVERTLPASNSPLKDALEAAIRGPSPEESGRNLLSLIPPGTLLLGASVQGNTAYINFSEDFLFNTYGIEGYAGQIRQVVWTATEFASVKDVQILVEGKRVDYLGEGIWIGSPLDRNSL